MKKCFLSKRSVVFQCAEMDARLSAFFTFLCLIKCTLVALGCTEKQTMSYNKKEAGGLSACLFLRYLVFSVERRLSASQSRNRSLVSSVTESRASSSISTFFWSLAF